MELHAQGKVPSRERLEQVMAEVVAKAQQREAELLASQQTPAQKKQARRRKR